MIIVVILILGGIFLFSAQNKKSAPEVPPPPATTGTSTDQNAGSPTSATTEEMTGGTKVEIKNFAFSPASITVKVGDSIIWTNNDTIPHSATADDSSFDAGIMQPGESKTVKFDKAGTISYHCSIHPNMKATVIVK